MSNNTIVFFSVRFKFVQEKNLLLFIYIGCCFSVEFLCSSNKKKKTLAVQSFLPFLSHTQSPRPTQRSLNPFSVGLVLLCMHTLVNFYFNLKNLVSIVSHCRAFAFVYMSNSVERLNRVSALNPIILCGVKRPYGAKIGCSATPDSYFLKLSTHFDGLP